MKAVRSSFLPTIADLGVRKIFAKLMLRPDDSGKRMFLAPNEIEIILEKALAKKGALRTDKSLAEIDGDVVVVGDLHGSTSIC